MPLLLPRGEPAAEGWRAVEHHELVELVVRAVGRPQGRPGIVAVDGRSGSGKSTVAARLQAAVPSSAVLATDDLAWNEPWFGWGHLLRQVLVTLHRGEGVRLRPPAWVAHRREGAVEVPAGLDLVVVEGVGSSQREHAELLDSTVWVQSDLAESERRGIARDVEHGGNGDEEQSIAFWREWMSHELPFLAAQQPWRRADLVVAGTPVVPLRPGQVALTRGPLGGGPA
ncbi:uridine kinase [uncultured Friedmanniella sp.]|uniref:uridine kinase family protein n=1 Tax=uncultured Friedmanniella sp. TaxID=335381 RepID=UPI0035C9DCDC